MYGNRNLKEAFFEYLCHFFQETPIYEIPRVCLMETMLWDLRFTGVLTGR